MPWHQQPIQAALQGVGQGLAWAVHVSSPWSEQIRSRQDLYTLRDQSGLTRQEFFAQLTDSAQRHEQLEVGNLQIK
jgi:hypothetical protein